MLEWPYFLLPSPSPKLIATVNAYSLEMAAKAQRGQELKALMHIDLRWVFHNNNERQA